MADSNSKFLQIRLNKHSSKKQRKQQPHRRILSFRKLNKIEVSTFEVRMGKKGKKSRRQAKKVDTDKGK